MMPGAAPWLAGELQGEEGNGQGAEEEERHDARGVSPAGGAEADKVQGADDGRNGRAGDARRTKRQANGDKYSGDQFDWGENARGGGG